ncbi:MAG: formylglycine-generating enzyme family protein [Lewinellaceae bacterium]|nr:formylglycine-generating enzyme family protein [Lewinellaceae bacterium]
MLTEVLPDGTSFEMILVEGGSFQMGSEDEDAFSNEKPVHGVRLNSFYIGKFPITQVLWKAVMNENPSFFNGYSRPVERVSWEDAQAFIQKLNGFTGRSYRLPTEAEWEYAARGGRQSKGYKYAGSNKLREVGWHWENAHFETKAVGLKYPNELGLYDMSGNVLEWCQDWYSGDYYEECDKRGIVENPRGPAKGLARVLRGGAWYGDPRLCRCTFRFYGAPRFRAGDIGFRLVLPLQFTL